MNFEYYKCVSATLVTSMQIASSLCRIILLPVTSLAVLYLSTLSHKMHDFFKNIELKYVLCLSLQIFRNFSYSEKK